ncbi:SusC/RagA family TonB-linked outer membrane protein [Flavobacterium acetivorans]|uniref:SusC/RagA family TonB-linked outer membrane protein n=1 Tax=Flavobacterium acetivorans TaxID=2893883 RepID=UPI001E341F7D|nr:SusC/RagA family TonB-linked outer membrane protein [Flavobacterium sp. F-29]UFH34301.1 SusC/RagA family TonB-linked outer membrane protein [Flavobacterium sp. F-29]
MKRILAVLGLVVFSCLGAVAQNRSITGVVADADNKGIVSATIKVKGISISTVTDFDGKFTVSVPSGKATLAVSSIGFISKSVDVAANENNITIVLAESTQELGEVVVTALGIKKQKKSLGYAVQEIKGTSLVEAREPNLANALTGKVAGLQVVRSSTGPGGSSKLVLRGFNSLTGDNQPLIVVDGVPMDNFTGASINDYWNPSLDMGNGIADINPEDIESLSVLKGPSAAALYGSRAGNGVILITTKTGRKQKGLGITVTSSIGFETIFTKPKQQNDFGQGEGGSFGPLSGSSWGPKIEGQSIVNWDGKNENLASYDNVGNYFNKSGITKNNSISFQQSIQKTSIYTSFSRMEDQSMIPGAKLGRTNLLARAVSKFGERDRWTIDTKVQYTNAKANNRSVGGPNGSNAFFLLNNFPRSLDITQFKGATNADGNMLWYGSGSGINPYWANKNNLNEDIRDRFMMNASLKYEVTDWLNAEIKAGADMYTNNSNAKTYAGSPLATTGSYTVGKSTFTETNYQALLVAKKDDLFGKFGGMATLGGNLMSRKSSFLGANASLLEVPNLFSINNAIGNPRIDESFSNKSINSLFGSAQLSYDGYLYLDATFRNDWSSTLSKENRSFFYPSVSLSYVFTDMFTAMNKELPDWFSYGKLRASYASVGNDLDPYKLINSYKIGKDPNGHTTASRNDVLLDPNVKSELIKSTEFGAEMRFFKSRFGIDVSVYKSNATNQLLDLPMDPLSGYKWKKINAGNIQNKGVELVVDGKILSNPNSLLWNVSANFSTNKSKIVSLYEDISIYPIRSFDNVSVVAEVGKAYGEIYGTAFLRVTDPASPSFGELLLDAQGLPQATQGALVSLGNQQAKAMLGLTNTFAYNGVSLSFLIDARIGGEIFSGTLADMQASGASSVTVVNGLRENIVANGVIDNGGAYDKNTIAVNPETYWARVAGSGNLGITEANIYDATNVRLRNVQLNYDFPTKFLTKTALQKLSVGLSCNNVWMIKSHMNGLDPESVFATGTNATGFENGSGPTTRTFLVNLALSF